MLCRYERTWPLYNGTKMGTSYVDPVAPTHVVNGESILLRVCFVVRARMHCIAPCFWC